MVEAMKRPSQERGQKHLNIARVQDTFAMAFGAACLACVVASGKEMSETLDKNQVMSDKASSSFMYLLGGIGTGAAGLGFLFAGASRRERAEKHIERRHLVGPLEENIEELHDILDEHLKTKSINKRQHAQYLNDAIKELHRIFRENSNHVEGNAAYKDIRALRAICKNLPSVIAEEQKIQQPPKL